MTRIRLRAAILFALPFAVLVTATTARLYVPDLLDRLSFICFDFYQQVMPREPGDLPVRIVDIDDKSLDEIGQWPWPRSTVAKLVDKLREMNAAVIGFDVVFAEPDRTSPRMLAQLLGEGDVETERRLALLPDPDTRLAEAMSETPVVAGFVLTASGASRAPATKAGWSYGGDQPLLWVDNYPAAVVNLAGLQKAAAGDGFLNQSPESGDHVVRRVPMILKYEQRPTFSLAAELLRVAAGARSYIGKAAGASGEASFGQNSGLVSLKIGNFTIPTDRSGKVWLHYAMPDRDMRYVSAADVIMGRADPAKIADNIVLVGTSAAGLLDLQTTPVAPIMPGVEVHAQLIEQVLQGNFLRRPDWGPGAEAAFTFLIGIGLVLLIPRIGAIFSAMLGLAALAVAGATSYFGFRSWGMLIDPVYPAVVLMSTYTVATLVGHLRTEAAQREVRSAFSRYMSPQYVEQLAKNPDKLVLGGEERVMTLLFADIRGFTTISEGLTPTQLTRLMNSFLEPMTFVITGNKGTIDKYIGDCIMAFWNAPLNDPVHPANAVRSALQMRKKLVEVNAMLEQKAKADPAGPPFKPIRIGMGINTGECVVGNFGSSQRFDYSVLGDAVNLASRLEGQGKVYGVDFVVGEDTVDKLAAAGFDPVDMIELDLVAVKGKSRGVRIFSYPPEPIPDPQFKPDHHAFLDAYRGQDWAKALALLDSPHLTAIEYLKPTYTLYRARILNFQEEPPAKDWDGVYIAKEK